MNPRFRVGFFAESCIPIHAHTLEERALGGTEAGLIRVAALLDQRGFDVTVFTSHPAPPPTKPLYLPAPKIFEAGKFDALILVQDWKPARFSLPSPRVFLWTGDGPEQFSTYGIGDRRISARIERFFVVSRYHGEALAKHSGFPLEKMTLVGNGVHLPHFQGVEPREDKRLIYASAPYRGLEIAGHVFQSLRTLHPDATFHVFSGMELYDRDTPFQGPLVEEHRALSQRLKRIPGIELHRTVPQSQLARELMKSAILFYPATVPETCCMVALEAQAAGCACVTSSLGALPETVGASGIVVPGEPGSSEFLQAFFKATDSLLSDRALVAKYSNAGRERVHKDNLWEHVALRMERVLLSRNT
jgi:glycosyltransferase involved in cell wall biosynthesis